MFTAKKLQWLLLAGMLTLGSGCIRYQAPFQPPPGLLFGQIKAPLQTEFANGGVSCSQREGMATSFYLHDPIFTGMNFAWDDCSVTTAAINGGLTRVDYADYDFFHVLGIFGRMTVHVFESPDAK